MTEEELPKVEADAPAASTVAKKVTLAVDIPVDDEIVLCEVCGHENPKRAALCEMCSNYLR